MRIFSNNLISKLTNVTATFIKFASTNSLKTYKFKFNSIPPSFEYNKTLNKNVNANLLIYGRKTVNFFIFRRLNFFKALNI